MRRTCRFICVSLFLATAAGCGSGRPTVSLPEGKKSTVEAATEGWLSGTGIRQKRYSDEDGSVNCVLSAERATLDNDNRFIMHGASLETVAADGRTVRASAGRISADSGGDANATLDGGVEVRIDDILVRTENATWDASTRQMVGPGPVTVTGDRVALQGGRFVVDSETRNFRVYNVTGSVLLDETASQEGGAIHNGSR